MLNTIKGLFGAVGAGKSGNQGTAAFLAQEKKKIFDEVLAMGISTGNYPPNAQVYTPGNSIHTDAQNV